MLDFKKMSSNWTKTEIEILKNKSPTTLATDIQKKFLPNKSLSAVYKKRKELNLKHPFSPKIFEWTNKEIKLFEKYASIKTNSEISEIIKTKSSKEVYRIRQKYGIDAPNSKKKYTAEKLKIIKENIHLEDKEIAKLLNESVDFVIRFRKREKIGKRFIFKKAPKYLEEWYLPKLNNNKKLSTVDFHQGNKTELILKCPINKKHIFPKTVKSLVMAHNSVQKINCPYCKHLLVHEDDTLQARFPKLSKSYSSKNKLKSNEIHYSARKKVSFICSEGHEDNILLSTLTIIRVNSNLKIDKDYECRICNTDF